MKSILLNILERSVRSAGLNMPEGFAVSQPPKPEMGDYATNLAIILAKKEGKAPLEVATSIVKTLTGMEEVAGAAVAGFGFINITLKGELYQKELEEIIENVDYGKSSVNRGKRAIVEFISANPTGPLHVGNARGGPIGEVLANVLGWTGYEVTKEFYVNDIGGQIEKFGESLYFWYAKKVDSRIEFPEGGYPGKYIEELSEKIQDTYSREVGELKDKTDLLNFFKEKGLNLMIESIEEDVALIDIRFDRWSYESKMISLGKSGECLSKLEQAGATVSREGAVWFKNPNDPAFEDKESVLVKSDDQKNLTYFTDDIAYHVDKLERADTLVDVWGANHHGHTPRLKAALRALGYDADKSLKVVLYQYVRLKNAGEAVKMGKRLGNFVTLREVIESGVEPDAFKYFILAQNSNTPLDFDIKLASDNSEKNPVFYVKYAHARICSIMRRAEESGAMPKLDINLLEDAKEKALYKELVEFKNIVEDVSSDFQVQSLPHYVYKISALFHDFYTSCQVLGSEEKLSASRLALILATKRIISNSLKICGISAPEKM